MIADVLEPDGLVLNHGITWSDPGGALIPAPTSQSATSSPGGEIPPLSRVIVAFERAGLETHHVESLHEHYSETLRHWATRLDQNLDEARKLAGDERVRVWRLYLAGGAKRLRDRPDADSPDPAGAAAYRGVGNRTGERRSARLQIGTGWSVTAQRAADEQDRDCESGEGDQPVDPEGGLDAVDERSVPLAPLPASVKTVVVRPRPTEPPAIWNM